MKVDYDLILKLEKLSRLSLDDSERDQIRNDLENIIEMVEKLQELDTSGVEPLKHMTHHHLEPREDKWSGTTESEPLLQLAPERKGRYFVIPKVVDKGQ